MASVFVDTGVWLALLDVKDALHERSRALMSGMRGDRPVCTDLVLCETVTLLRREAGPARAAEFARDVLDGKAATLVRCEWEDWREAIRIIERYPEQKVSVADATSMAVVRRLKIETVASFDKHFRIVLTERRVVGPE